MAYLPASPLAMLTALAQIIKCPIASQAGMGVFELDANGGISVASTASLDYDTTASYTLTIGVSDGLDADGTADTAVDATKTFIIGLTDVNDIAPDITVSAGSGTLTDGAAAGTDTGIRVVITDDARGEDFAISYKNFNGFADIAGFGLRQIGAETVIGTTYGLYTTAEFDFDAFAGVNGGGITMLIGVSDILDGITARTDEELASVSITFTDINDNGPEVAVSQTDPSIPITLDETTDDTLNSMAPRNVMGLTIEIDDADRTAGHKSGVLGITPTFRVLLASSKDPIPQFDVVKMGANWVLQHTDSPQQPLKAQDQATFEVIIEVSDGENPATESDPFTINVNGEAVYSISESGNTLTADLDTTDPNGVQAGSVRYQWFTTTDGGTTKDTIATSGTNSIANTTSRSLNTAGHTLPSGAVYGVEVTYTDDLGIAENVEVIASSVRFDVVPVHNAATHPLTDGATPTTNAVVIPNTAISAMGGTGKIVYSIDRASSVGAGVFQINPNDGRLLVSEDHPAVWDYETTERYEIVIVATDANDNTDPNNIIAGTGDTARIRVIINVDNVQEGDAVYEITQSTPTLAENTVLTARLLDGLAANDDPDGVEAGSIRYQWRADGVDITGANGMSYTIDNDDDVNAVYSVEVTYLDGFNAGLPLVEQIRTPVTAATASIKLTQDGSPTSSYTGSINEDGTADNLPTIAASVAGAPSGHTITYQFLHSDGTTLPNMDESGTFTLDSGSGEIDLNSTLNHETTPRYELSVRVTYDADGDSTTTNDRETMDVDVVINVGDVNEHAPEFAPSLQVEDDPQAMAGSATLAGATSGDDTDLDGTADAEYIDGDAGNDEIDGGGGNDHILGGAGNDTIDLSSATGSVETVYYRFSSAGSGAWTGSDGTDTINNFRRGEDRLVFVDTAGTPISRTDFLSNSNLGTVGGQLSVKPIFPNDKITGVEIRFGSNKVVINYATDSHVLAFFIENDEGNYTTASADYLGAIIGGAPSQQDSATLLLTDHATLLPNYFGTGSHTNLQIIDDANLETIVPDVLISEKRTSADGVFASVSATDGDATAPNNQVSYGITGGTGMGLFDIDTNGGISVASSATFDYDTTTSYTLTITATDGGTPAMTSEAKTITIGLDVNDVKPEIGSLRVTDSQAIAGLGAEFAGATRLAGATSGDDPALAGTADAELIDGDAGDDTITSGGGNDHINGGTGDDTIILSDAKGSVETIYYRFSSTDVGRGVWVGSHGSDTIRNFRRGEDRLIFVDTDGTPISLTDFLSNDNLAPAGGQLGILPSISLGETLVGVEIRFGSNSNRVLIEYSSDSRVPIFDSNDGYLESAEDYLGDLDDDGNPTSYNTTTRRLTDNSLLPNYFNEDSTQDNLQVIASDTLLRAALSLSDVLISEKRTSTDGVFASVSATDSDGTAPNNEIARYDITGGTGMGLFAIDENGGISVASSATFDYDTTTSYTLEITATDGGATPMTSDPKSITIELIENGEAVYSISENGDTLTADLDTADPDGVEADSVAMYRWFTTTDAGANKNYLGTASTSNTLDTSISGNGLPQNAVYGVEITYTDGLGFDESVDARQSTIAFSAFIISARTPSIDGTRVTSAINNDNDLIVSQALSNAVSIVGSGMASFSITGGADKDHFTIAGSRNNLNLRTSDDNFPTTQTSFVVEITATNSANADTAVLTFAVRIFGSVGSASPAQIPDRQAEAHDPYDPDQDLGLTPLPEVDPNG